MSNRLDRLFEKHMPPEEERIGNWYHRTLDTAMKELQSLTLPPGAEDLIILRSKHFMNMPPSIGFMIVRNLLTYLLRDEDEE